MSCPSELTLCEYADGELPSAEANEVAAHLGLCPLCRALEDSLATENALLCEVLRTPETARETATPGARVSGGWAAAVLGLASGPIWLQSAWEALPTLPRGLAWMKDFGGTDRWWSVSQALWTLFGGAQDMSLSVLGFVSTLAVALGSLALVPRRRGTSLGAGVGATLAMLVGLTAPSTARAAEVRCLEGGTARVAADEVVDDSVFLFGETALVAGVVEGDLFVAAERVEITGTVRGNVYGGAETFTITGQVDGNVHALGETVELMAPLGGSAFLAGETVVVGEHVALPFGGFLAGETVRMKGESARDLYFGAETLELSGRIQRHVHGFTTDFAMTSSASIGGDLRLTVTSDDAVQIDDGARIDGDTHVEVHQAEESRPFLHGGFYLWTLARLLALLLFGFVAVTLFPTSKPVAPRDGTQALKHMGIGFVGVVATPVAALIVGLTVIGLPLALVVLALFALALFASTLVVASFLAERAPIGGPPAVRTAGALLVLLLLVQVPVVGHGLSFLVTLLGTGGLVTHLYRRYLSLRVSQDESRYGGATP